jgi:hypothetical protein
LNEDDTIGAPVEITEVIVNGADCYPWTETFVIFPKKTITGKRLFWQKAFKRRVWVVWGQSFHMEPETQYATAFDMMNDPYEDRINSSRINTEPWQR